ncbi:MAG: 6-phosphogluconolactonase [Actinomycetota bacterium]|nr:6-phosphogluconolactonase [Actinomycetota bacterium]
MTLALEVLDDPSAAARRVAGLIAERARDGASTLALSRGAELVTRLAAEDVPWERVIVHQVDERVAPSGHEDRNLTQLLAELPADVVRPMPVEDPDLDGAARRYADELPEAFELVHLGLGLDGHTASLVPGDLVLDVRDLRVAVTDEYQGYRRMTLTYPVLEGAHEIVWLVTGEPKREVLARLLERDTAIPAARIDNPSQLVVADRGAAGR